MSALLKDWRISKDGILNDYYKALNDLEKDKYLELNAAITIQKYSRKFLCTKRFVLLRKVSLEIQRNFKGYLARAQHKQSVKDLSNDMNKDFYGYHATIITRFFRGYQCRKSKLDYHERRKYLQRIKQKNEETLAKLQEYSRAVQYQQERKKEEDQRKSFNSIAANLHHLISTKTIPGVYNPPNIAEESKPQVYNSDIETHLKAVFKNNLKKINAGNQLSPLRIHNK
jgi:hypothetical protein